MMGPHIDTHAQGLRRIEAKLLRARLPEVQQYTHASTWTAEFFGLQDLACFSEANSEKQESVLAIASQTLLAESWNIECSGVRFCAKMSLLSEGIEEQRVFALVGADEATHSAWLEPWIDASARAPDAFSQLIMALIETGNPQPLSYLLQVVLEGFGIVHYTSLAEHCTSAPLAAILKNMAQDEALHHAAGLATFRADRLTAADRRFLVDGAQVFLQSIRGGPQAVVAAVDRVIGIGDATDAQHWFEALRSEESTAAKLGRMQRLMMQPGMEWLIDELTQNGLFAPCTAAQSAQLYRQNSSAD